MISCFCHEANENCAVLGYYAVSSGNFSPTFRDNLWVPSSAVKNFYLKFQDNLPSPIDCPEMSVRNYHYLLCNNPEQHSSNMNSIWVISQHWIGYRDLMWTVFGLWSSIWTGYNDVMWTAFGLWSSIWIGYHDLMWTAFGLWSSIWTGYHDLMWTAFGLWSSIWTGYHDLMWTAFESCSSIWIGYHDLQWAGMWCILRDPIHITMLPDLAWHQSRAANDFHIHADVLHLYELTGKCHDIYHDSLISRLTCIAIYYL